jgi:hypothetical protein
MRSLGFPSAALLPRKREGRSESCATCFTAKSLMFAGSLMSDEVDERRQTVWVLTIRHGAGRKLKPSDLV